MSVTTITILIILIILGSIAFLAISQARERAKITRARKWNSLQDSFRHMQRLLSDLPPQYLNNELRIILLQRALEILGEQKQLNNNPEIDKKAMNIQETIKLIHDNKFKLSPRSLTTEAQGKEARQLMETLVKFIETQVKKKRIAPATAQKHIQHTIFLICQSKSDYFYSKAVSAEKSEKPRIAIHNYHNAISEFKRMKDNPLAIKAINLYKSKIRALEKIADANNLALKKDPVTPENNAEWDKFLEHDDQWKKKNAYDD